MFAKALASDEANAACHYNAGNSYQALGNRSKAITHFSKALALGMDEKAETFILQSPIIATYAARIARKWPLPVTNVELFGTESVTRLASDLFLRCAMEATTLTSVKLELLLGYARAELLRLAGEHGEDDGEIDDDIVAFACALAQQCFINRPKRKADLRACCAIDCCRTWHQGPP
jgi:tetratricopeptide (TPR) repeat protein